QDRQLKESSMLKTLFKKPYKLYLDILLIFVSLFIFSMLTVIIYMQYSQYQQRMTLSKQILEQKGSIISAEIDNYLKPAQISELLKDLLLKNSQRAENPQFLTIFMESTLRSYPYMSSIYMVDNNGSFTQELRILEKRNYARPQIVNRPPGTRYITYLQEAK